jgi:sterol desaturase/sphingolipid hydroxylase (fatty acid hydroxylase superfamily)
MPDAMHLLRNLTFGVLSGALVTFSTDPAVHSFNHIMNAQGRFGILHLLGIGGWANVLAYFVLTDFIGYFNHWAFHRVPFLWRFHKVHHTDTDFDFSTYFRTHFGEDLLGVIPGAIITLLLGPTMLAVVINGIFGNLWSQYQHMNVRLPRRAEAVLSRVIMTSEKHYIHHSMHIVQTNSNYASVFSFWDKFFGTYRADDPDTVTAGLENYQDPKKLKFWDLVMMPFRSDKPASSGR